jgi:D-serine ammonia-lyase
MQLKSPSDRTRAVVVSTLVEAWQIIKSGLVKDGTVDDVGMGTSDLLFATGYSYS